MTAVARRADRSRPLADPSQTPGRTPARLGETAVTSSAHPGARAGRRSAVSLRLGRIAGDRRGSAAVAFAVVAPVFLAALAAIMEFAGIMLVQAALEGTAREASRYGITGAAAEGLSREERIRRIAATYTFGLVDMDELEMETLVYSSFGAIGQPEPFTDRNGNGAWDEGESFSDVNGNGTWDDDGGAAGLGGGSDIVVYRLRYDWGLMIPLLWPVLGESVTLRANMVVRNEPYD